MNALTRFAIPCIASCDWLLVLCLCVMVHRKSLGSPGHMAGAHALRLVGGIISGSAVHSRLCSACTRLAAFVSAGEMAMHFLRMLHAKGLAIRRRLRNNFFLS